MYAPSGSHRWITTIKTAVILVISFLASGAKSQEPSSLTETYGNWTVQCRMSPASNGTEARRNCQASQELRQTESGSRIVLAALTIPEAADGGHMTFVMPFGLLLPDGMTLKLDDTDMVVVQFRTCLQDTGCIAENDLSPEQLSKFTEGHTLSIQMVAAGGQRLRTNLSLEGFEAAHERLRALQQEF